MNRTQYTPDTSDLTSPGERSSASAAPRRYSGRLTQHALFMPLHYEPNYAYPLLVWLHGQHDDETQLRRIMPGVSTRNYVAVAPRGTLELGCDARGRARFGWAEAEGHVLLAEQRIFECMDVATSKMRIAAHRVFLAGSGAGGSTAFRVALKYPDLFAGVASLGGPFPHGRTPLARLTDARRVSVLITNGRGSRSYDDQQLCDDLRLLHAAGMDVTLRIYSGTEELGPQVLGDLDRWIMDLVTGGPRNAPADRATLWDDRL